MCVVQNGVLMRSWWDVQEKQDSDVVAAAAVVGNDDDLNEVSYSYHSHCLKDYQNCPVCASLLFHCYCFVVDMVVKMFVAVLAF